MPSIVRDGDISIHYEEWGDRESPAVVLLHGFTGEGRSWKPVAEELAEDYRVIAPDLRGHGRSSSPEDPATYSMEAYAEDLTSLLDTLEIDLCAMVGSSFGGMVAMQFAVTARERLAGLVISDSAAAREHPDYAPEFYERERRIERLIDTVERHGTEFVGKQAAAGVNDSFLAAGIIRRWAAMNTDGFLGSGRARNTRANLLPLLKERLTMPVLLCAGERDPVYSAMQVIGREVPGARFVTFREAGHTVPLHRPDAFSGEVLSFLHDIEDGKAIVGARTV